MTPIMCVGETLDERESGATESQVLGQVAAGLAGRTKAQVAAMVVAYEPIWAISTGRTATSEDAQTVSAAIRASVAELTDTVTADAVRIQYGGSVKASNIAELMSQPDIDGALVSGASLDADEFARIVQFRSPSSRCRRRVEHPLQPPARRTRHVLPMSRQGWGMVGPSRDPGRNLGGRRSSGRGCRHSSRAPPHGRTPRQREQTTHRRSMT